MAAGLNTTLSREIVDQVTGNAAARLNDAFSGVLEAKAFLDVQDDAILTELGYTSGDIATLRSAFEDLAQLRQVYVGAAEQTPAKDFRTFAQRIWGTGGVIDGH